MSVSERTTGRPELFALAGAGIVAALLSIPGCSSPFSSCSATRTCPPKDDSSAGSTNDEEAGESGTTNQSNGDASGHAGSTGINHGGEGGLGSEPGNAGEGGEPAGGGRDTSEPVCGNGRVETGESCDDGNLVSNDGCTANCSVEPGLICVGEPSVCSQASCGGLAKTCGASASDDCCAASLIPGLLSPPFYRSYDGGNFADKSFPAELAAFRLDIYEVSVGRFKAFVAAYPGSIPGAGAGKNPNNPSDQGWDAAWSSAQLPATQPALIAAIQCDSKRQSWSAQNDALPMNCLDWYEAEAFCIWDGGRLPTETEWNYAAAGGSDQRVYPWGATAPDSTLAVSAITTGSALLPSPVGSKLDKSKWGQKDLAGNVWEWTQDWYASPYKNPCSNCANLTTATRHSLRGGGFNSNNLGDLTSSNRSYDAPVVPARSPYFGVRCARRAI